MLKLQLQFLFWVNIKKKFSKWKILSLFYSSIFTSHHEGYNHFLSNPIALTDFSYFFPKHQIFLQFCKLQDGKRWCLENNQTQFFYLAMWKKGSVPLFLHSVTFSSVLAVKKLFYRSRNLNENFSVFQTSSGSTVTRVGRQFKTS